VLALSRDQNVVGVVLACRYSVGLRNGSHADDLNHKVAVLVSVIGIIGEVAVGRVKSQSYV